MDELEPQSVDTEIGALSPEEEKIETPDEPVE